MTCNVAECAKQTVARGMCPMHWQRWRKHGDPLVTLTRYPPRGLSLAETLDWFTDRTDEGCHVWSGMLDSYGYGQVTYQGRKVLAHRAAWFVETGEWPELQVLHRCDNPPCIKFADLELGTRSINMQQMWDRGRHPKPRARTSA